MAHLKFVGGDRAGQTVELNQGGAVIGRRSDCDVIIADGLVSQQHARIVCESGAWSVVDLKSSNGTLVNAQPVATVPLKDGDLIQIGEQQMLFGGSGRAGAAGDQDLELVQQMRSRTLAIRNEVGKVIIGQQEVLDQIMMVLIAGGHGLLIGMPGMAKTLMVRTIAQVLDLEFKRIQFTPDLMPTDITGTEVLETNRDTQQREFRFVKGPIFCNLLLADEINRTPPKTQAALLEAMQEKRVTVGNVTYSLDDPFFVLATQNPIEQEGTYPLPEAQLDRFMFNIWVDYPQEHEEEAIVSTTTVSSSVKPGKVLSKAEVLQLQEVVRKIPVSEHVIKYATRFVRATRPVDQRSPDFIHQYVGTGAGPRAGQYLVLAAKARAVLDGRIHVSCTDIRNAALPVLRHRLLTNFAADSEGLTSAHLIKRLLEAIPEPSEKDYGG
jgi:MoxR-like ATPase